MQAENESMSRDSARRDKLDTASSTLTSKAISVEPDHSDKKTLGFTKELEKVARVLEQSLDENDLDLFYKTFRQTNLPFVGIDYRDNPTTVFERTRDIVKRLGNISPAVALAVENHLFVVAAIATLPTEEGELLHSRRLSLIENVRQNRWLVANTNSRVHGEKISKTGTVVRPCEGGYCVSGEAAYMSLATSSDLMIFISFFESGEPAIFSCPVKDNPHIEIGPLLFKDTMQESDTRRIRFNELVLKEEDLLVSSQDQRKIINVIRFEMAWHQTMLGALSLGTAERAIEEGRSFLRSVKRPDGTPLAELDGMVVDMGRQAIHYQAAVGAIERAGVALGKLKEPPLSSALLREVFELACVSKYISTRCAEDIVGVIRRIIGARSFTGGHPLERLSKEVLFAQLGGEVNAFIERRIGERILSQQLSKVASPKRLASKSKTLKNVRDLAISRRAKIKGKS